MTAWFALPLSSNKACAARVALCHRTAAQGTGPGPIDAKNQVSETTWLPAEACVYANYAAIVLEFTTFKCFSFSKDMQKTSYAFGSAI